MILVIFFIVDVQLMFPSTTLSHLVIVAQIAVTTTHVIRQIASIWRHFTVTHLSHVLVPTSGAMWMVNSRMLVPWSVIKGENFRGHRCGRGGVYRIWFNSREVVGVRKNTRHTQKQFLWWNFEVSHLNIYINSSILALRSKQSIHGV